MIAKATIVMLSRKKPDLSKKKYVSQEAIYSQGRLQITKVEKGDPGFPVDENIYPFEMKNRVLPDNIRKNVSVRIEGYFRDLTKKKKILVVNSMLILSTAANDLYNKKGYDVEALRTDSNYFTLDEAFQNGYGEKKRKIAGDLYTQQIAILQEIFRQSNISYDVEVSWRIIDFFKKRAQCRHYSSVTDMIKKNPWVLGETEDFPMSVLKKVADRINPAVAYEAIIYAYLTNAVWSYTRRGNSYAPLGELVTRRMRNILTEYNIDFKKRWKYLADLATPKLQNMPDKNMSKLMYLSQYREEAFEYYHAIYKEYGIEDAEKMAKYGMSGFYLIKTYYSEKDAASMLTHYIEPHELNVDKSQVDVLYGNNKIDKWQRQALLNALTHRLSIINGPAGSGKTHVIAQLVRLLNENGYGNDVVILAQTAMAAAVAAEKTKQKVDYFTIHRVAKIRPEDEDYGEDSVLPGTHPEPGHINKKIVIVDEMGVCDICTFSHLLHSMEGNDQIHLVLVGDIAQLPAIGPSGFFHQLVRAGSEMLGIPVVNLEGQHRSGNEIYDLANMIRRGEFPESLEGYAHTKVGSLRDIKKVASKLRDSGISIKDILFLAPTVTGKYGTRQLNQLLRGIFNPGGKRIEILNFHIGDPVITTKNFYADNKKKTRDYVGKYQHPNRDKDIHNGTKGIITSYDADTKTINVLFTMPNGTSYDAPYSIWEITYWLDVAFAITVHKAQGSEATHVVLINGENKLNRNMLYTAWTRRKEMLYLLGSGWEDAVKRPVLDPLSKFIFRARDLLNGINPDKEHSPEISVRQSEPGAVTLFG